jgi:hypothetical protein
MGALLGWLRDSLEKRIARFALARLVFGSDLPAKPTVAGVHAWSQAPLLGDTLQHFCQLCGLFIT